MVLAAETAHFSKVFLLVSFLKHVLWNVGTSSSRVYAQRRRKRFALSHCLNVVECYQALSELSC